MRHDVIGYILCWVSGISLFLMTTAGLISHWPPVPAAIVGALCGAGFIIGIDLMGD